MSIVVYQQLAVALNVMKPDVVFRLCGKTSKISVPHIYAGVNIVQHSKSCSTFTLFLCIILCIIVFALYFSTQSILCIVLYASYDMHHILLTVFYALYSMHCIPLLYSMHCVLFIVFYGMCAFHCIHCILSTICMAVLFDCL